MGGANPNDQITATHLDFNKGAGSGVPVASVDKKWDVQSAHPEAVSQGMIKGIGSLASSAIGAGAGAAAQGAAYHGQFGSDQMSGQGFYENEAAAKAAGIENPQQWTEGTGEYGNIGTGWYAGQR